MNTALWLLVIQGAIGAFDTVYYHEVRARLPARGRAVSSELRIHAARDVLYAVLFGTLPWLAWHGMWAIVLAAILIAEIVLTLTDFVVERRVRKPMGDVYAGERVTHAIMGIIWGAVLTHLTPVLLAWNDQPSAFVPVAHDVPLWLRWALSIMAVGVLVSGIRDCLAATGRPGTSWPWPPIHNQDEA